MKKKITSFALVLLLVLSIFSGCSSSVADKIADEDSNYIQLSQVKMHYTKQGNGEQAVILLHGNGADLSTLSGLAEKLSYDYSVYSLDSRCHGDSTDTPDITYDLMANDVVEFVELMGLEKPYIVGHSDGGITALTIAITHPDLPGAIVPCGANSTPDGISDSFHNLMKLDSNNKLVAMMLNYPNFTEEDFAKIICPTLVLCGEYDIIKQSDSEFIASSIKGASLEIIAGANHTSYILNDGESNGEIAYEKATEFFDAL